MALTDSRRHRIMVLCGLYVAQGVPWGFMLITLPAYLAYNYQLGDDEIGQLKAIILIPWSFKLLWAPLMDTFTIRSMGRRRPWIIGAELMMAVSLLGFIGLGDPSEKLRLILWMYFLHNCFASLQDVCTDALAVDVLPKGEHGKTNGLMWASKLVGKGIGAWGLSHVLNLGGLGACVAVQVGLLLAIMLLPLLVLERPGEKRFPWSAGVASADVMASVRHPREVFASFLHAFTLTTTWMFFLFCVVQGVGGGVNAVVQNTLYTQWLNPRWTDTDFSTVSGLYTTPLIILSVVLGGFLADRFGGRTIMWIGSGGMGLSMLLFAACPSMWNHFWFASAYLLACEVLGGVSSVGYLAIAMRISWTRSAAIVFTAYLTLGNVTNVAGNWLAGTMRELFMFGTTIPVALEAASAEVLQANLRSYELTFGLCGVITLLPLLMLFFVRPEEIDRARERDDPAA